MNQLRKNKGKALKTLAIEFVHQFVFFGILHRSCVKQSNASSQVSKGLMIIKPIDAKKSNTNESDVLNFEARSKISSLEDHLGPLSEIVSIAITTSNAHINCYE